MMNPSCKKRQFVLRSVVGLGVAVSAVVAAMIGCANSPARAESPLAPPVGEAKPFTENLPGTKLSFDLVPIPGGKFKLGSPDTEKKRKGDEGPQADVTVEPFYMGKYEVTWDLYTAFLNNYDTLAKQSGRKQIQFDQQADAVSYPTPIYEMEAGPKLQRMGGRGGKYPAVILSHFAAKQFTKWISAKTGRFYRLPTEAEWEFAARGGTDTAYFFGNDAKQLGDYAWTVDNSKLPDDDPGYHEVGKKKPNPYGLFDIYGNAAEIVLDQYDPEWYKGIAGKPITWREAVRWPDKQYPRIARGGGYESEADQCRSASRQKITVAQNTQDPQGPKSPYWWTEGFSIGFRVISPLKEPTEAEKHKFWDPDNESVNDILKRDREFRELMKDLAPKK